MLKRAEGIRGGASDVTAGTWLTFTAVMQVLTSVQALEVPPSSEPGATSKVLPLGLLARGLQGQNELWLAMALSHPAVMELNGSQFAAFLGALLSADVVKRPVSMWASYSTSEAVVSVVEALEPTRQMLFEMQTDAGLAHWNDTLLVDLRLAGLVEAWAAGATWAQIMEDSSLDDGDVARLLMRTVDLLRQVVFNSHLVPHLKDVAQEALQGMDRKPIADGRF